MKILFVTDNGFSQKNGENYFSGPNKAHVEKLNEYFDEFIFIARNDEYDKSHHEILVEHKVYLFQKYNLIGMISKLNQVMSSVDIVICYGTNGYFASKVAKKFKKPIITYNGGDPADFLKARGTITGKILAPLLGYMEKDKIYHADYAHYCASFLKERYPSSGKTLIASGVEIFLDDETLLKRNEKITNNNDSFKIGLIGHTKNNLKGIDTAIKALAYLPKNFKLEIVGRGNHKKYDMLAKSLGIGNRVNFLGTLSAGRELFEWLDSVDIYIQPSLVEGLPRATIEAMSRACPIITTNAGALNELIDKDFRIEFEDDKELARKIKDLSQNKQMMLNQAQVNYEKAKEFDPVRIKEKYKSFYGNIIED